MLKRTWTWRWISDARRAVAGSAMILIALATGSGRAEDPPAAASVETRFTKPMVAKRVGDLPKYPHKAVRRSEFGRGGTAYWLFEPAEPMPQSGPVIVFNHGWLAVNPAAYGAWISHLVRSGAIVIYPRYQADALTLPRDFLPNAVAAVQDAFEVLDTGKGRVRADHRRFALIGHSAGANLAAQMAAIASENHLPVPKAIIAMMPGEVQAIREPDLSRIPSKTLLVVAVAENDRVVGDVRGRQIFHETTSIPPSRKKFIFYRSDLRGIPRLLAHHLIPTAAHADFDSGDGIFRDYQMNKAEVNAYDRAGFWRVADLTLDAAFQGKTLDEATRNGEHFRHLGYWSDGRAVNRAIVGDDLSLMPRVRPSNGIRVFDWAGYFTNPNLDSRKLPFNLNVKPEPGPLLKGSRETETIAGRDSESNPEAPNDPVREAQATYPEP